MNYKFSIIEVNDNTTIDDKGYTVSEPIIKKYELSDDLIHEFLDLRAEAMVDRNEFADLILIPALKIDNIREDDFKHDKLIDFAHSDFKLLITRKVDKIVVLETGLLR